MCRMTSLIGCVSLLLFPGTTWAREVVWLADAKTDAERRFDQAFSQRAPLDFDDVPLNALIDYFRDVTKLDILIDRKALAESGIALESPISIHTESADYKSAFRLVLDELGLTWTFRGEIVWVTTKACDPMLTTKIYDVRDLMEISPSGAFDCEPLIHLVTGCIAQTTWDEVGGPGAIVPYRGNNIRALVISQTIEVHEEIASLFSDLRHLAGETPLKTRQTTGVGPMRKLATRRRESRSSRVYAAAPAWSMPQLHE